MAFELTINGKTETFETAEQMYDFRERMKLRTPKKKKRYNKKSKTTISSSLTDKVSESVKSKEI